MMVDVIDMIVFIYIKIKFADLMENAEMRIVLFNIKFKNA